MNIHIDTYIHKLITKHKNNTVKLTYTDIRKKFAYTDITKIPNVNIRTIYKNDKKSTTNP